MESSIVNRNHPKKIKNLEPNRPKKGPEGGLQYDPLRLCLLTILVDHPCFGTQRKQKKVPKHSAIQKGCMHFMSAEVSIL